MFMPGEKCIKCNPVMIQGLRKLSGLNQYLVSDSLISKSVIKNVI